MKARNISIWTIIIMAVILPACKIRPKTPIPQDRWKGEYYNNINLQGDPKVVQNDGADFIKFDWEKGGPRYLNIDYLSIRWTRKIHFDEGTWLFCVNSDDGIRVLLDGKIL